MKDHEKIMRLLQQIRRPISYACQDSFSHLSAVKNLGSFVARQIRISLGEEVPPPWDHRLQTLRDLFEDFDHQPLNERKRRLRTASAMMGQIDKAGQETPEALSSRKDRGSPIPWEMDIQYVKGVGARRADYFKKLAVKTLEDLLYFVPWRYEDRGNLKKISQVVPGEELTLCVEVHSTRVQVTPRKRLQIFELMAMDETGGLMVKWFNQPYLKNVLKKGHHLMLSGSVKVNSYDGRLEMENPQFELISQDLQGNFSSEMESPEELIHTGRIVPIYHETRGLTSRVIRSLMKAILDTWSESIPEMLPRSILDRQKLPGLGGSLQQIHFPDQAQESQKLNRGMTEFHRRLIFDDFFLLQVGLAYKRREVAEDQKGIPFSVQGAGLDQFLRQLPFSLTVAQKRVIEEIKQDMIRPRPMNRLVQGDVGCGKTLVALVAFMIAIQNGYQGAFMAPTEILAEQHYLMVRRWFSNFGLNVVLVTSGLSHRERQGVERLVQSGAAHLAVGTHALLQEEVKFKRLGMVVIDEQHKFGVLQRGELTKKGYHPDVLIMTATPIPRTLALTAYGDMDVSIIDELPPGRSPVETILFDGAKRSRAYEIISKELTADRQAYVVYPLVEESEKMDLKAAVQMEKHLKETVFPGWRVGLLHGQMKPEDKEKVMLQFKDRQIDLLVATSVIEVGIDVPNATVMLIEHAERFGLAQLHQLRGRVGRGSHRSICLLIAGSRLTQDARNRLEVMVQYQDGFIIAEKDLALRGPGEFFGTRQSGLPDLK
ncbi:MAG: ATP-dependent DNA helicase RecG, partial [Nitrospira sp.]|nr:ATP-dependent DNA helicase RecG [Nitrospira sp.]